MNISTTIEQSNKLLSLGIKPETADMSWVSIYDENHMMSDYRLDLIPYKFYSGIGKPAWSLSALLDLIPNYVINKVDDKIYANLYYGCKSSHDNLVDAAVELIEQLIENKHLKV